MYRVIAFRRDLVPRVARDPAAKLSLLRAFPGALLLAGALAAGSGPGHSCARHRDGDLDRPFGRKAYSLSWIVIIWHVNLLFV